MSLPLSRGFCLSFSFFCTLVFAPSAMAQVRINEFLAKNLAGIVDEDGDFNDWIEVHNSSSQPVSLLGWHLTDDAVDPNQWTFPDVTLDGDSYLVVMASSKDRAISGSPLHTNFKLSTSGEFLALSDSTGAVVSSYDPGYPQQSADISFGLQPDGISGAYFNTPTPGGPNGVGTIVLLPISISPNHGLYSAPFIAQLEHAVSSADIRYTLDGTVPTIQSPLLQWNPVIRATATIRLRAFAPGYDPSVVQTVTYLFASDVVQQDEQTALDQGFPAEWIQRDGQPWTTNEAGDLNARAGARYGFEPGMLAGFSASQLEEQLRSIPSLSVVMHPDDIFGYQEASGREGIYSNSVEDSDIWERACSAEWIEPDGSQGFTVNCGISIQGGSSTNVNNRGQLSMSLHFRSSYGPSKLNYQVFQDSSAQEYDKLILDSHNQNSINGFASPSQKSHAMEIRDPFIAGLVGRMGHITPHSRYAHVYLNGLHWGIYAIHERPDDDFAAAHLGGDSEEYDYVKRGVVFEGNSNRIDEAQPGLWAEVVDMTRNPITPGSMWRGEDAWAALQARVDMGAYADYLIANWYGGNTDWPHSNWTATARSRLSADYSDVNPDPRFQFHVWDAETTLLWGGAAWSVGDGFYDRTSRISNYQANATLIHWAARHHPDWLMLFADRAHRLLSPGGALYVHPDDQTPGTIYDPVHPERNVPASVFEKSAQELESVVHFEFARWANYGYPEGTHQTGNWAIERDRLRNGYFAFRSNVLRQQLEGATPRLYPTLRAPVLVPASGELGSLGELQISHALGASVYYTLDGTDPREALGGISPTAKLAGAGAGPTRKTALPVGTRPPAPGGWTQVQARAFDGTDWSPLESRDYIVGMDLALNELMSRNDVTISDESGEFDDWFELKNNSSEPFDLTGFYISDDASNPQKWSIPAGTVLEAGTYQIFWADGDTDQGALHADFSLSGGGEFLGLFAPDGLGNLLIDGVDFPSIATDQSFGREPDSTGPWAVLGIPTPGSAN
ncbi:MAG: hypothetical protein ACI87O_002575 [Planctomycetota bacterium]|jgi:hypothetical protein